MPIYVCGNAENSSKSVCVFSHYVVIAMCCQTYIDVLEERDQDWVGQGRKDVVTTKICTVYAVLMRQVSSRKRYERTD